MERTYQAQTNLSGYNNSWYNPGSPVKQILWYLCSPVFVNSYLPLPIFLKIWILKLFGANIGENVIIKPKVNIKYPWFLKVESNVWIGENVWIDNLTMVTIAPNACLSQGAMLLTGNHNYKKSSFDLIVKPITIGPGAWVGAQSVVCPGVEMASHSVLTVNSVATQNLEPYGIYQGNPAVFIKRREITN